MRRTVTSLAAVLRTQESSANHVRLTVSSVVVVVVVQPDERSVIGR